MLVKTHHLPAVPGSGGEDCTGPPPYTVLRLVSLEAESGTGVCPSGSCGTGAGGVVQGECTLQKGMLLHLSQAAGGGEGGAFG